MKMEVKMRLMKEVVARTLALQNEEYMCRGETVGDARREGRRER